MGHYFTQRAFRGDNAEQHVVAVLFLFCLAAYIHSLVQPTPVYHYTTELFIRVRVRTLYRQKLRPAQPEGRSGTGKY